MSPQPGISEPTFFSTGAGLPLGVCLMADATAEHECGITQLRKDFGAPFVYKGYSNCVFLSDFEIWQKRTDERGLLARLLGLKVPLPAMGMTKRQVSTIPDGLAWLKAKNGREGFGYSRYGFERQRVNYYASHHTSDRDLVGGWSDDSFYVFATSDDSKSRLRELYAAILAKNAMFSLPMGTLMTQGLCIVDLTNLPDDARDDYYKLDKDKFDSDKALFDTGIAKHLKESGKGFHLSRYHLDDDGEYRAWLNPDDNGVYGKNKMGWYTIEELRLWCLGEGPVVRADKQVAVKRRRRKLRQTKGEKARKRQKRQKRQKLLDKN